MSNPPPFNLAAVEACMPDVLAAGERVLQTHMFAPTPELHVDKLLYWLQPRFDDVVLDMGCGVGEVPRLMNRVRPDLTFLMVNISRAQLAECPVGEAFVPIWTDGHATDMPAECCDSVMFSSTLINMDAGPALIEAARLVRKGGVILINELVRKFGDNVEFERLLGARVSTTHEMLDYIEAAGLRVESMRVEKADDSAFRRKLGDAATLLDSVTPTIWRLIKR